MLPWFVLFACQSEKSPTDLIYQELYDQGMGRYVGEFEPDTENLDETGFLIHQFSAELAGPRCMTGEDYHVMTRDQGHENMVLFLQGGGLCYSEICIAVSSGGSTVPDIDIMKTEAENPVGDWNQVYVPYCDGSLFAGDVAVDSNDDGTPDRYQYGLRNLTAAIDVASNKFPHPKRILLAGSSGGGYGSIWATILARWAWPESEIYVFNDSGVGLGMDGKPDFILDMMHEFQAESILPASLTERFDSGHVTPLIDWQLQQDSNLKMSAFSYRWDYVIARVYLAIAYETFDAWLQQETEILHQKYPERYNYFIAKGADHTVLIGDPSGFLSLDSEYFELIDGLLGNMETTVVDDRGVRDWLRSFVEDADDWTSIRDDSDR